MPATHRLGRDRQTFTPHSSQAERLRGVYLMLHHSKEAGPYDAFMISACFASFMAANSAS